MLLNLVRLRVRRVTDLVQLIGLETKLAGRTLVRIIILMFVMIVLIIATWIAILVMIFTFLIAFHFSALTAAIIITLLNLILLIAVIIAILRIKENLFFPATRRQLSNTRSIVKKDT